jgi:hypothetical protein
MAKTRKEYIVSVTGDGSFPIDMLRYDSAVPATEVDSGLIEDTFGLRFPSEPMTLQLRMMRPPTEARWKSFDWPVTNTEERTHSS